jgi:hypothetical protein
VPSPYRGSYERFHPEHQRNLSRSSVYGSHSSSYHEPLPTPQDPRVSASPRLPINQAYHPDTLQPNHPETLQPSEETIHEIFTPLQVDLSGCHQDGEDEKNADKENHEIDRDLTMRNLSVIGLVVGWLTGIATLTIGVVIIREGQKAVPAFLINKMMTMAR